MNTSINFEKALQKLNRSQREAVETIEGPVMVLAGPGTGKTEVLSVRIGHILQQTDAKAENILCLTFSRAGVFSMKKRLKELIGNEAEKIEVSTFHSFAMGILSNSVVEEKGSKREVLSEGKMFMIIEKLLSDKVIAGSYYDEKPLSTTKIKTIIKIINLFKKELIERKEAADYVEQSIELLNTIPEYQLRRGGLNAAGRKLLQEIQDFGNDFINIYEAFLKIVDEKNGIVFQDMLIDATYLLQQHPEFLRSLQIKYQYILVDEFQDTNLIQLLLIQLLIKDVEKPNIFIVGDDDQTIYRFQGANLKNTEWVGNMLPAMKSILLDTNYRSTNTILQTAFQLISNNKFRHPLKIKALIAGNESLKRVTNRQPVISSYETEEQEAFAICNKIKQQVSLLEENETIAVLARTNKELMFVQKWLNYFEIPIRDKAEKGDVLHTAYGKIFYYTLNCINWEDKDQQVASDYFCNLLLESRYTKELVYAHLLYKTLKSRVPFLNWLRTVENDERLISLREVAIKIGLLYDLKSGVNEWSGYFSQLEAFSCQLVKTFPAGDLKSSLSAVVGSFLSGSFESVVDWFNYYKHFNLVVEFNEVLPGSARVHVRTIHSSKGNEYDYVYLMGLEKTKWEEAKEPTIKVPKILNQFINAEGNDEEDLRRLLYVGLTRAKKEIAISYHRESGSGKKLHLSNLLSNLVENSTVSLIENNSLQLPNPLNETYLLDLDNETLELMRSKMIDFKMSPSSTNSWEECQNKFFFHNICKLPGTTSAALSFGSMVHKALEELALIDSNTITDAVITHKVHEVFIRYQYHFHPFHRSKYRKFATTIINSYLEKFRITATPFKTEDYLTCELENGVKLNGFIDKIDVKGNRALCIDYKTNKYTERLDPFISETDHGSNYWNQGMIYRYLIEANYKEFEGIDMEFHYVALNVNVIHDTEEDDTPFKEWLLMIWNKIHSLEFAKKCENPSCRYCELKLRA